MKLSKFEKARRKAMLKQLEQDEGIVYFNPDSGVTVAVKPSIKGSKARYAQMAVSMCSENDKPRRKNGEYEALCNLYSGVSIPVKIENWKNAEGWKTCVTAVFSRNRFL